MPKKAIVLLAEGFEEVEAVTPIDYLRRAGIEVIAAAVGKSRAVTGSHGIILTADAVLSDLAGKSWDAVILPGGMPGAKNLAASKAACDLLKERAASGALICAICASPAVALAPLGLLAGKKFTCFPGMEETVKGAYWSDHPVVIDGAAGGTVTSRGAGTAGAFAAAIIGKLLSETEGKKIARSVLLE
jgi:4-methyl-5(b-hydroxyethyl)-thiazole monophosphate biosynthesis